MRYAVVGVLAACSFHGGGSLPDATGDGAAATPDSTGSGSDAASDAPSTSPLCDGYRPLTGAPSGSTYQVPNFKAAFEVAVLTCSGPNRHLAKLDSQAEADALFALVRAEASQPTAIVRVVGERDGNGPFLGLDGTVLTFLPWGVSEPTSGTDEDCIGLRAETGAPPLAPKVIGAHVCSMVLNFACECE